jgi:hypothetical protein
LIEREFQANLLVALFRILVLLISATPYDLDPRDVYVSFSRCCVISGMLNEQVCSDAKGVVAYGYYSHVW